jgi:hypothetical protein
MKCIRVFCSSLLLALASITTTATAESIYWTNRVGGDWTSAKNWSPNQVPGVSDTAGIPSGVSVTISSAVSVSGLDLRSDSTLNIQSGGELNLVGAGTKVIYGVLINQGRLSWAGSANLFLSYQGAGIENTTSGVFEILNDQTLSVGGFGGEFLLNRGTLRKLGSAGASRLTALTNTGKVEVQSGSLILSGTLSLDGTFIIAPSPAELVLATDGQYTLAPGLVLQGGGPVRLDQSVTLFGTIAYTNFSVLPGNTLLGQQVLAAPLNWSGGSIHSDLSITANGALNLAGPDPKSLYGTVTNRGVLTWTGTGNFYLSTSRAGIENSASGLLEIRNDQTLFLAGQGTEFLVNLGTLRKRASTGTTRLSVFASTGRVEVESGSLVIAGNVNLAGTYSLANGSGELVLNTGGTYNLVPGVVFTGGGPIKLDQIVTLHGTLAYTNFSIVAGNRLYGRQLLDSPISWSGGDIYSEVTVTRNGALNLVGADSKNLYGVITNHGKLTWSGTGNLYFSAGGVGLENSTDGEFDILNDQMLSIMGYGTEFLVNKGLLRKSSGSGTSIIAAPLDQRGSLEIHRGTMRLYKDFIPKPESILSFGFGGPLPGSQHGRLVTDGKAQLGGTVTAQFDSGFVPTINQVFTNLLAASVTNRFANTNLLGLGNFRYLVPVYSASQVVFAARSVPRAEPDRFILAKDAIATGNVLANDSDEDGDPLNLTAFTQPSHGVVAHLGGGTFRYTPVTGYTGPDQFSYTLTDTYGATAVGTVFVSVGEPARTRLILTISQNHPHLTWGAVPGKQYRVQYRTGLESATWVNHPDGLITAASSSAQFTDLTADVFGRRFYRIEQLP